MLGDTKALYHNYYIIYSLQQTFNLFFCYLEMKEFNLRMLKGLANTHA